MQSWGAAVPVRNMVRDKDCNRACIVNRAGIVIFLSLCGVALISLAWLLALRASVQPTLGDARAILDSNGLGSMLVPTSIWRTVMAGGDMDTYILAEGKSSLTAADIQTQVKSEYPCKLQEATSALSCIEGDFGITFKKRRDGRWLVWTSSSLVPNPVPVQMKLDLGTRR